MSATLIVRHTVADYDTWLKAYEGTDALRSQHGCTAEQVLRVPGDPLDVAAVHEFPSVGQAEAFAGDASLKEAMQRGGVTSAPRVEIFENA